MLLRERDHAKINIGRQPAIKAYLCATIRLAGGKRR